MIILQIMAEAIEEMVASTLALDALHSSRAHSFTDAILCTRLARSCRAITKFQAKQAVISETASM